MVEPQARIRPYHPDDEKLVKFTIGKAAMEGLAVANRRAAMHPLTVSIWIALSCIMVELLGWWPKPEFGQLGFLSPLPAFGCWGVPILFAIDWINRPYFEELVTDVLHRPDLADIEKYYTRSRSSGFFILEHDNNFIGFIAVDASKDSQSVHSLIKKGEEGKVVQPNLKDLLSDGTSSMATIRHFYVEEPYRKAGAQDDLLRFALRHSFTSTDDVRSIQTTTSPLLGYVQRSVRDFGFRVERTDGEIGVYRWTLETVNLDKVRWDEKEKKGLS
ncbi:hypothetical protein F5I97DRAFT_1813751 [Phlebopus sp. FC_14]|nr:hypothetical protein F5I97DRAFT_1813751 [Phlebopus sp. FC_14]